MPPLRSLMLNFSKGEAGLYATGLGTHGVNLLVSPDVCSTLQQYNCDLVGVTYGDQGLLIREGVSFLPEGVMKRVCHLMPPLYTAGGSVVYFPSGERWDLHELNDMGPQGCHAAQPAPVLLVNAINNGLLFYQGVQVNSYTLSILRYTPWVIRVALRKAGRKAVQEAIAVSGRPHMRDLLEQYQLVTEGLETFARVMNEQLEGISHET